MITTLSESQIQRTIERTREICSRAQLIPGRPEWYEYEGITLARSETETTYHWVCFVPDQCKHVFETTKDFVFIEDHEGTDSSISDLYIAFGVDAFGDQIEFGIQDIPSGEYRREDNYEIKHMLENKFHRYIPVGSNEIIYRRGPYTVHCRRRLRSTGMRWILRDKHGNVIVYFFTDRECYYVSYPHIPFYSSTCDVVAHLSKM